MKDRIHVPTIIFSTLKAVFFSQGIFLVLEIINVFGVLEYNFSLEKQSLYLMAAPVLFFLLLLLMMSYDRGTINQYSGSEEAKTIKDAALSYLKKNIFDDVIISFLCVLFFQLFTFFGAITPIVCIQYLTLELLPLLFLSTLFLLLLRMLSLFSVCTVNILVENKAKQWNVAMGVVKGVTVSALVVPIGALFTLLAMTAISCVGMLVYLPTQTYELINKILTDICFPLALPVAWRIAYTRSISRRNNFLYETEGYISAKDGIALHFNLYKRSEIASAITVFVLSVVLTAVGKPISAFNGFYALGGLPLVLFAAACLVPPSQIYAVYASQKSWRIRYFLKIFGDDVRRM